MRYIETLRLLLHIRRAHRPDLYILGFRGHEIAWVVRRLTRGRPLVFDALMSPFAALTEERKAGTLGALLGQLWRPWEARALREADLVLTDTVLHAAYYTRTFGLAPERILPVPVAAAESTATPEGIVTRADSDPLHVLFYGSFLPLHGIEIIVEAAASVKDIPLRFDFIGGNPAQAWRLRALCANVGVSNYTHRTWVSFDELIAREVPAANLCLGGPFGGTPQARRVVAGKTSQCLALGRPTIIGAIDANYGFVDKHNCLLVPQGDARALASALRWAYANREALPMIGQRGQMLYRERLSVQVISQLLYPALEGLAATDTTRQQSEP